MKQEYIDLDIVKNLITNRFELEVNGFTAFIDFKESGSVIKLIHTETAPELAGLGVAKALILKTLKYIEQNNFTLMPICPLVFAYIKKNSEWKRIVDANFVGIENL
ncbi:N-acetyltransferase [Flavobacterium agricola]|uniref:N-acetyltransferase n=1 Tax=Flavobacterium agricola TaxID=2870839 RepID=A0ABY6LVP4_9FLAO|nr:GNAT family N-acetyltransferase [Flavobacterium agricola]UYW00296.1 N-acetyltransferase [Flavobacterium agricola]